jgi:hypothetical protein
MYSFKEKVWLRDTTKAHVLRDVQKYAVRWTNLRGSVQILRTPACTESSWLLSYINWVHEKSRLQ